MKKIIKIIILLLLLLFSVQFQIKTYAAYIESKPGTVPWTNITVSDSFDLCRNMNNDDASLGNSSSLIPHLTTNKDWNAVALLSATSFGLGSPSNTGTTVYIKDDGTKGEKNNGDKPYYSTTGNLSGVMNMGANPYLSTLKNSSNITQVWVHTASLLKESQVYQGNYEYRKSLIDNVGTPLVETIISGYTEYSGNKIPITDETGNLAFQNKGTGFWSTEVLAGIGYWGCHGNWISNHAVGIRNGLFQYYIGGDLNSWGYGQGYQIFQKGGNSAYTTFRPVIWNS